VVEEWWGLGPRWRQGGAAVGTGLIGGELHKREVVEEWERGGRAVVRSWASFEASPIGRSSGGTTGLVCWELWQQRGGWRERTLRNIRKVQLQHGM
jgi:hypothetical protein